MLVYLLALTIPTTTIALLYARWEYRKRGELSLLGLALLCLSGMTAFRPVQKILCIDSGALTTVGVYRWGRNPHSVEFQSKTPRYAGWGR